jgi:hypothetical protein
MMMSLEKLKFPGPWLAGLLAAVISLFLTLALPPLYLDIPIKIILGYACYPLVLAIFKTKIDPSLGGTVSKDKPPEEDPVFSLATYQLPGVGSQEPLRTIITLIIFWGIGEVAFWGLSMIWKIMAIIALVIFKAV